MILPGETTSAFEPKRAAFVEAIASESGVDKKNVHIWLVEVADHSQGIAVRFEILISSHATAMDVKKKFHETTFGMNVGMKLMQAHVKLHPVHLVHIGDPVVGPALATDWQSAAFPPAWVDPATLAYDRNVTFSKFCRPFSPLVHQMFSS
jgi:hypothetical protein